jgi:hypothetical protein
MHKAVAARLANPNISLYDALLMGGFDYSTNDDKSILDSKKVTLGQRKNQLSRRLRLARKQIAGGGCVKDACTTSGTDKVLSNAIDTASNNNTNCKEEQSEGNINPNDKPYIAHSISASNKTIPELADDLVSAGVYNNGNNDAIGNRQCKKPRLNNYLRGTSFDRTCTMATATNQELNNNNNNNTNINQHFHQGFQLGNVLNIGGNDTTAPTLAVATGSLAQAIFPSAGPIFNSQISDIISDQQPVQQSYQSGTSAMALSSLSSSAHRAGLTLDQLALILSSNEASLTKLVSDSQSGESMAKQEQLALDIYKAEVKSLYTKCLLIAGVDASLAEQNTPTYTRFASKAWEFEGKRIRSLNDAVFGDIEGVLRPSTKSGKDRSTNDNVVTFQEHNNIQHSHNPNHDHHVAGSEFGNNNAASANQNGHDHDHNPDHATTNNGTDHDSAKCDARHMHRIGECGHRAIIHQPKDGTAPHIDFIVNDRVECYSGQDSMSLAGRSLDSAWPSKYKCKEVEESSCAKACGKNVLGSKFDNGWAHLEPLVPEPKIFKLSDIDTEDPEWTFDANEDVDGGVLGLFKLGRDSFI